LFADARAAPAQDETSRVEKTTAAIEEWIRFMMQSDGLIMSAVGAHGASVVNMRIQKIKKKRIRAVLSGPRIVSGKTANYFIWLDHFFRAFRGLSRLNRSAPD
jgi:hypothetical protein